VIGSLCALRGAAQAGGGADAAAMEHVAAFAGPVLALMMANERKLPRRLRNDLRDWLAADGRPARRLARRAMPVAAVMLLLVLLLPTTMVIGGHARLEGAVQRVLSAPADGFVQQVHARAGDAVRAGQPLLDLADQDLQLERQRWQSQLAQQLDALAAAQARSDRALLVQTQGKADEAQAQLDLVNQRLARSRLVAPFDGIVVQGDLSQQLGAPVKQGAELMTLAPSDAFRVIVEVDERDVAYVQVGQPGTLALSALPWDTLPLRVNRITPVATAVEGRNVFEVEAELLDRPAGMRPGLQGTARIEAGAAPTLWQWTRRLVEQARLAWWEWWG
jgi:multidrug efflux pump subunit AcrA (membrane-fusion protein)